MIFNKHAIIRDDQSTPTMHDNRWSKIVQVIYSSLTQNSHTRIKNYFILFFMKIYDISNFN